MTPVGTRFFLITGSTYTDTQFWREKSVLFGRKEQGAKTKWQPFQPEKWTEYFKKVFSGTGLATSQLPTVTATVLVGC